MSVYSERFVLTNGNGPWATVWTVPVGQVNILRDIEWVNGATAVSTLSMSVSSSSGAALFLVVVDWAAGHNFQWQGRLVMNAGDQLLANSTAGNGNLVVSGYAFPSP